MATAPWNLLDDLNGTIDACESVFRELGDGRLFITGGTGFIGCWLLETLCLAVDRGVSRLSATVLTRDPDAFSRKAPHLAGHSAIQMVRGDVCTLRTMSIPGRFTHLIHAATDASADLNENSPLRMFDTVLTGTREALQFGVDKGVRRVLYLSSGAVYGNQPWEMERVPEDWRGGPNCLDPRATYAEAKRAGELLCVLHARQHGLEIPIARIFALLGPYLSLDIHFAAGNFIRDALGGKPIVVNGNGLPQRSYLYAGDLTTMLWHLLCRGRSAQAYNVGSEESISIADLARRVGKVLHQPDVEIRGADEAGWNLGRYVPSTEKLKDHLGLTATVSLDESIRRTALWNGWKEALQ